MARLFSRSVRSSASAILSRAAIPLFSALLLAGCAKVEPDVAQDDSSQDEIDDRATRGERARDGGVVKVSVDEPLDEHDPENAPYYEFARRLEKNIVEGDLQSAGAAFDFQALLAKSEAGLNLDKEFKQGFNEGVLSKLTAGDGLLAAIAKGNYHLLRLISKGAQHRAVSIDHRRRS